MAKRRPAQFWEEHLEAWRRSGRMQVEYCVEHGLNRKSFGRWLRKVRAASAMPAALPLTLVPVRPVSPAPSGVVTLHSPGGWRVELSANSAGLAELLRQLP